MKLIPALAGLLVFCALPAHANDGPDPAPFGEISVQLLRSDALGTDSSGSLKEIEIGTFGIGTNGKPFFGILKQKGIVLPVFQANSEIHVGFDEETQEINAFGLNSTFGLLSRSHFLWNESNGVQRSGGDVGVGAFFQLESYDIQNALDDFYLSVGLRTNSLLGGTRYPGAKDDRLTGVYDLDVGASFAVGETAKIRLRFEQVRSWVGASDGRVFEQVLTATYHHESVDFYAKIQTWKVGTDRKKEFRVGVQFTDFLPRLIAQVFPRTVIEAPTGVLR